MHGRPVAKCWIGLLALTASACFPEIAARAPEDDGKPLEVPPIKIVDHPAAYQVFGNTAAELLKSVAERGPETEQMRGAATTRWKIWADGNCKCFSNGCRIANVSITMDVEISLPEWSPRGEPNPALRARWDRMVAALETHEIGHRTIAIAEAEALRSELPTLGRYASCGAVQQAFEKTIERTMARQTERQRVYDEETQHGIKQGTVL